MSSRSLFCLLALLFWLNPSVAQYERAAHPTLVGLEYALTDNDRLTAGMANLYGGVGLTSMKLLGEASQWGKMQRGPKDPIDFTTTDRFVREYQRAGVDELIMALKSHSKWGSVRVRLLGKQNPTPKPQYRDAYRNWVAAIIERYDADGYQDMPGLRRAVRYFEIGSEFSSYEPEPVNEYLDMLAIAYQAAKKSNPDAIVTHAAFLTTPVNLDLQDYRSLDKVWRDTPMRDRHHNVADIRKILDRPDLFDLVNIHNLGDPYEIEHMVRWLNWEMTQRNYGKQIIISDTIPTSYIAWGPAVRCDRKPMGVLIPPATDNDRCQLADFFSRLVDADSVTLDATRQFVAADHIKRTLIAADMGIVMINLSFSIDLPLLTGKFGQAGAGISGWGGAAKFTMHNGKVKKRYPLYFMLQQLMPILNTASSVRRVHMADASVRFYEISSATNATHWVAWLDQQGVHIPGTSGKNQLVTLPVTGQQVEVFEPKFAHTSGSARTMVAKFHSVKLMLGPEPVYLRAKP